MSEIPLQAFKGMIDLVKTIIDLIMKCIDTKIESLNRRIKKLQETHSEEKAKLQSEIESLKGEVKKLTGFKEEIVKYLDSDEGRKDLQNFTKAETEKILSHEEESVKSGLAKRGEDGKLRLTQKGHNEVAQRAARELLDNGRFRERLAHARGGAAAQGGDTPIDVRQKKQGERGSLSFGDKGK